MHCNQIEDTWTRRELLTKAGGGLGALALSSLLHEQGHAAVELGDNPLEARKPHFEGKAKHVIWLFINGGPPTSTRGTTSPNSPGGMARSWKVSIPPPGFSKTRLVPS